MDINILYIDDQKIDLDRYAALIEESSTSDFKFIVDKIEGGAISSIPKILDDKSPDLILVDFDFSDVDSSNNVLGMNGASYSNLLRQKFSEIPIILLTRPEIEERNDFPHNDAILACIDGIKHKEDLIPTNDAIIIYLINLSIGYKQLRNCEQKTGTNLLTLIAAPQESYESLKMSYPKEHSQRKSWNVFEAVTWIRKTLMQYPGILYDDIHAATYLGVTISSFNQSEVRSFFTDAKYSGVFYEEKEFWWKTKLQEIASASMDEKERLLPLRKGFSKFWKRVFTSELSPSVCNFSNESPAETVCYILNEPVMFKYSLRYYPDNRPEVMDETRVSFKAIQTRNEVNFDLFDEMGLSIIKERKLKPR